MNNAGKIVLDIRGLGHVPSFKNSKMLTHGKLITKPERQQWMQQATQSIVLQLLSVIRTSAGAILTVEQLRSWIASSLPLDDCRQWIPEIHLLSVDCLKGSEGATIEIEKIM